MCEDIGGCFGFGSDDGSEEGKEEEVETVELTIS